MEYTIQTDPCQVENTKNKKEKGFVLRNPLFYIKN